MRIRGFCIVGALAAGVIPLVPTLAFAQASAGDVAQARELFNQGRALRERGDLAGALEKLRGANALVRTPITAVELGRTYVQLGQLVEAREAFLAVGRIPIAPQETPRSGAARAEATRLADQIRPRIPSLTIRVTGVPQDVVMVTVDGSTIPTEALAAPRLVDPGQHTIVATSTTGGRAETGVDVKEGESRDVELTIVFTGTSPATGASPSAAPSSTPMTALAPSSGDVAHPGQTQRIVGIAVGATGVAAMATSVVLGFVAKSQYDHAVGEIGPPRHDDSLGATHLADAASVIFGVGAAAAAAGAVLWFTAPKANVSVGLGGDRVVLSGSFR